MGRFKDLTGMRFGRLAVVESVGQNKNKNYLWRCRCDCGNEIITSGGNLTSGKVKSCGCLQKDIVSAARFDNLVGKKFGRLTVLELVGKEGYNYIWKCQCECGDFKFVKSNDLRSGHIASCGCLRRELSIKRFTSHGLSKDRIFTVWVSIKARCLNCNSKAFKRYGGRGITMYPAWANDFQAFYDYVSKLPHFGEEGYTLDRINNDGNYEPDNIRWATVKKQARNRCSNRIVEYQGVRMTLAEAAEKSGINYGTLHSRLKRGGTGEHLFRPLKK